MPELPEVETIKEDMVRKIKGRRINKVDIKDEKSVKIPSGREFKRRVEGKTIQDIKRRGKYLILNLNSYELLIFHLKLTGRVLFFSPGEKEPDYSRVVFVFSNGSKLFFTDVRRFGEIYLLTRDEIDKVPAIKSMGPEPLSPEFTARKLKEKLKGKRGKIKPALMNQAVLAGVGNIYSQEALYRTGIHPERNISRLTDREIEAIYHTLVEVLKEAIQHRGSSVDAYVDLNGKEGGHVPYLQVYGREGEKCPRCGSFIKKKKISGRGTYFCEGCQK